MALASYGGLWGYVRMLEPQIVGANEMFGRKSMPDTIIVY
jgi:hypothetical protein